MTETLRIDRPRAGVVVLQLNRPRQLNAINGLMRTELTETVAAIASDASVHAVVLTGLSRWFLRSRTTTASHWPGVRSPRTAAAARTWTCSVG
ncbi:enoyl-CoA hydratase-related protein [Mycobacterium sp.]|uniref:enoyl-CoA hydratase-related protein n=1 Tax=Mycobacterium sp. TaxID=1785 RepID=UPI00334108F8